MAGFARLGPASLLARTNLTLAVSSLVIVAISIAALQEFVVNPIVEQSADDEAALLVLTAQTWVELPPEVRLAFELELAENHDLIVNSEPREYPPVQYEASPFLSILAEKLTERLGSDVAMLEGDELVWVSLPGYELQIGFSATRRSVQPLYGALIIAGLGAGVVFVTSLFIVLRVTRPLVETAKLAETFRGAENFDPLPERGPKELVVLARNFNTMASEIATLLSNRTTLLAGISHDLRTPLTRMRLALELLPDTVDPGLIERFERNVESMDELITDALKFARGTHEAAQAIELHPFVADVLSSYELQVPLETHQCPKHAVMIAPGALRRVLTNLVTNAQQHGGDVRVRLYGREIHVVDSGPGIPVEYRDEVFQPFFRIDRSRSMATGGSGLGLAIVHQLCQAHGWRVDIGEGPDGGADVCVAV